MLAGTGAGSNPSITRLAGQLRTSCPVVQVSKDDWNACATGCGEVNPFVLWEFLNALEQSQSAVRF